MIFANAKYKDSYILTAFERGMNWIKKHVVGGGIAHSSTLAKPYPEVTGYYIPSLLKWGEDKLAQEFGDWLLSIQTPEGAWQDTALQTIYTFDTGQILKGMYALISFGKKYEDAFIRGCDWLLQQIDADGRILTPTTIGFSNIGSEYIHLYALEPLKLAAEKYGRKVYVEGYSRALKYYLSRKDLTDFTMLSHFHAYIIEALIDLGQNELALEGLQKLQKSQSSNGAIPAFVNVRWVCLTAMFQYAVCYYKLGMLAQGNKLVDYALSKQNPSGGFYGGSGWFVTYFKNVEISWANKYLLDALHYKLKLEFSKQERAESFLLKIDKVDQRYALLNETIITTQNTHSKPSLLDVGCGKGRYINNVVADGLNVNIIAMDVSDKLFKYLPERCDKKIGSICQIPVADNQIDIVFCSETLEHAVNIEGAIKELARVCKPGGTVIVIDKDLTRKNKIRLEVWEQWFDKDHLVKLMQKYNLITEVKELRSLEGPTFCAWVGKKVSNA